VQVSPLKSTRKIVRAMLRILRLLLSHVCHKTFAAMALPLFLLTNDIVPHYLPLPRIPLHTILFEDSSAHTLCYLEDLSVCTTLYPCSGHQRLAPCSPISRSWWPSPCVAQLESLVRRSTSGTMVFTRNYLLVR
jgi:hypothetical protein